MKKYEKKICNVMNNARDELMLQIRNAYDEGYEDGLKDGYEDRKAYTSTDTEEAEEKAYNRGLDDAWDVTRKIIEPKSDGGYSFSALLKVFDELVIQDIFKNNTATEAIAKIKEYEDKQKQDAEIKVGDEVYSDAFDDKGIVTHITTDKVSCVCIICNGFTMMKVGLCSLHKTGRHFDAIAEVLAELRGAE